MMRNEILTAEKAPPHPLPLDSGVDNNKDDNVDFSLQGILASIAQQARIELRASSLSSCLMDAVSSTSPQSMPTPEEVLLPLLGRTKNDSASNRREDDPFWTFMEQGASWQPAIDVNGVAIYRLADVQYENESPKQSLDLYFPASSGASNNDNSKEEHDTTNVTNRNNKHQTNSTTLLKRPVYIHIHGGGWSRGNKASPFYGGPAMCQNAAASGCIAVAVGYRLGKYPEFLHDAAHAIHWVHQHIGSLGGDLNNVFLSGHSAGGQIASLLMLRHEVFLTPLKIPRDFCRGLVLVSGVYDLFSPLKKNVVDAKNKWFNVFYVLPAFGTDTQLRKEASPLLILDPNKDTSMLGTAALTISRSLHSSLRSLWPGEMSGSERSSGTMDGSGGRTRSSTNNTTNSTTSRDSANSSGVELAWTGQKYVELPSTLILNATFDMGLQENGELMAKALSNHTHVQYQVIAGSDHASICWNETTAQVIADFVQSQLTTSCDVTVGLDAATNDTSAPEKKKPRRGKRDKMPRSPAED